MDTTVLIILAAAAGAVVAWAITHKAEKSVRAEQSKAYERSLAEIKENQAQVLEATKTQLELQNQKLIKEREQAIKAEAEQTIKNITGGLNKDIIDMKAAFEAQKKASTEEGASIKTKFEETVANLRLQTDALGNQANSLANAIKGQNKMQGIFGETILENILKKEGMTLGRDYDTEFWLRDRKGNIIVNEDTGKRMRPDFALHFPDDTDIIVDSKMSLTALADWFAADNDADRAEAAARNLQSVKSHIDELTSKEYQKYVEGRKTLDYVIMFIPNYGAYQLAKQEDPDIFTEAFERGVLITTEETLLPFLRLIRSAWIQKAQLDNMAEIVDGARKMVERVALFCEKNTEVETALRGALDKFEKNTERLVSGNQSIVKAAQSVVDSGVHLTSGRTLPNSD